MTSTTAPAPVPAPGAAANNGTNDANDDGVAALLATADVAIAAKDARGTSAALGSALALSRTDDNVDAIVDRVARLVSTLPGESETALGLLTRAEERAQGKALDQRILLARAALHENAGHTEAALSTLSRLLKLEAPNLARGEVLERMGDLAKTLGQQQTALIHYQGAFRAERTRTTATRKAMFSSTEVTNSLSSNLRPSGAPSASSTTVWWSVCNLTWASHFLILAAMSYVRALRAATVNVKQSVKRCESPARETAFGAIH
jgi:tetratricopeptide (TPR) repeat protein